MESGMGPWLIKALNFVLLGASCFLVADVVTEVGAEALEPSVVQPAATRPESSVQTAAVAPRVILDRNLFGAQLAGDSQVVDVDPTDEPLTATKLPLRLLGTAAASHEARSRAAIEDETTRKHLVVAVGDRLEGHNRVKVMAIERTRVILDNAGRPEELALHEDDPNARKAKPKRNARQARRKPRPAKSTLNDRLKTLNGDDGQGISRILSSARIVPEYNEAGEMQGMKVDAIKADSVFEKVGLLNGDVITEVNGIVMDRLEATSAIFDEFATAEQISVAATRGSEAVILSASAIEIMEQE
jgi:type II secretion system protein C